MPLRALEDKIQRQLRFIELKRGAIGRRIGWRLRDFERKNLSRAEFRFFRSLVEKPLTVGAFAPSGKALARVMAAYVDPTIPGPIVELGPGTGPVTEALVERGIDPQRLTLVEYDREFCRLLRQRFPGANVVRGDAYKLRETLAGVLREPAAAFVSGLPLFNKPLKMRLDLLNQAFALMKVEAPFVQFTYNAISPIPRSHGRVFAEASGRVWRNFPPARVWVYRANRP
ncbi:MAG: phospholipid methyltransferase [Rhizobiales bacterium]|nr:phospholipid methyltransferase [Hyphomicrobiales bacterium]